MSFTYRPIRSDEIQAFIAADSLAFGHLLSPADAEIERAALEVDRAIAAFEGDTVVGTTATLTLELTVPGGVTLPAGGLTWTAVVPTHRRRGILSRLMERQLRLSREREEPASVLLASEGNIYGRFGHGPATWAVGASITTAASEFRVPPTDTGRCRMLDDPEVVTLIPAIFDRNRATRHGSVSRTAGLWHVVFADPEHHHDGAGRLYHVVHQAGDGTPDGYVSYRFKPSWTGAWISDSSVIVAELIALTAEAYAALWRYCLDMDLAAAVHAETCAPDEPLRWLLADPRQLQTTALVDQLWLRLLDPAACLAARTYAAEGELVLEVHEPEAADPRTLLLQAAPEGAACDLTTRRPDLVLGIDALSAAYLGGTSFAALARGVRVDEATPGALARADRLFTTAQPPWCTTHF